MRYLIVAPRNKNPKILTEIEKFFIGTLKKEEVRQKTRITTKGIKKLMREYKKVSKLDPKLSGFRVEIDDNDAYKWKIFIRRQDGTNYEIFQGMEKLDIDNIELELLFPPNYPFSPPFVRIVGPRFTSLTGHITDGGAVCMQLLTNKFWSPVYSIESLIVNITSEIIEGEGSLDKTKLGLEYSAEEAKKSFVKMATGHGWM